MKEITDCLICQKHRGKVFVPGGVIYEDDLLYSSHALIPEGQNTVYLGWLILEPKRYVSGLSELTDLEAKRLGVLIARLSRTLKSNSNIEHIYMFVLGHHLPHLHVHLVPRYRNTPREFWGFRVNEWPDALKGDAGQIGDLTNRLTEELNIKDSLDSRYYH